MSLYLGDQIISGQTTLVGESRNIGQIIPSAIPLTDAGLHLLDGVLIQGSGIYSAFVTYIAGLVSTYPNLFVTESAWQTAVSTYGVCGKFVYDSVNNTVRLPKVTGKLDGTTDVSVLGDLAPLGIKLPNITGSFSTGGVWRGETQYITGAFTLNATRVLGGQYNDNYSPLFGFDASRSSSVYSGNGSDTTIHEQAINVLLYIVIATTTKTDVEVDIDEIATDLNGKADVDLSNINASQSAKNEIVSWGMPDYSSGISLAQQTISEQTFTMVDNGFLAFTIYNSATSKNSYIYVNNHLICSQLAYTASAGNTATGMIVVNKADVIRYKTDATGAGYCNLTFYPVKGAN